MGSPHDGHWVSQTMNRQKFNRPVAVARNFPKTSEYYCTSVMARSHSESCTVSVSSRAGGLQVSLGNDWCMPNPMPWTSVWKGFLKLQLEG